MHLTDFYEDTLYSPAHKFPKNPLKVPTFPELERPFWEEYKRRQALRKEQLKKKREENNVDNNVEDDEMEANEDDEDIPALPDVADDDIDDRVNDSLLKAIDKGIMANESLIRNQTQRSFAERIEESTIISNYEDLVRKHVEEYLASAQQYAQTTELSKRVTEWEDKVLPKLHEEETHPPFDINFYGSSVIDTLVRGKTVPFKKLVQGKPTFEIARMFLAALMLANTGNVRIEEKGELDEGMDKFEMELLSLKRHFEELQEYTAPSLSQE